jgi:hypothetical protein
MEFFLSYTSIDLYIVYNAFTAGRQAAGTVTRGLGVSSIVSPELERYGPADGSPMNKQLATRSPRTRARVAGVFYLLTILAGAFALFVNEPLRSVMLAASTGCYIAVTVLFYGLFRPVSRNISAVAAVFSLVGCSVSLLGLLHLDWLGLNPLVFFGCYCLVIGYLILRSTFLPRILGALMALGGLGWLTFVSSALSNSLSPYNMAPGVLGETALTLWLLAMGVNVERWNQQAAGASSGGA